MIPLGLFYMFFSFSVFKWDILFVKRGKGIVGDVKQLGVFVRKSVAFCNQDLLDQFSQFLDILAQVFMNVLSISSEYHFISFDVGSVPKNMRGKSKVVR